MKFRLMILSCFIFSSIVFANASEDLLRQYNDPNMHFPASKFDTWEFRCKFSSKDEPTYWYVAGNWGQAIDTGKREYQKEGPSTKAGSHGLSDIKYYFYKGKNPLARSQGKMTERFYYYRFSGKAAGMITMDNYLIAVDTYTKLVFAFAIPVEYKNILWRKIPEKWVALESGMSNKSYKFYEYDPVGIVLANGTFELYSWHLADMSKGNYKPTMMKQGENIATYGKAGRSPYYSSK